MTFLGLKGIEPEISDWLNQKPNKSQTAKEALRMLYQKELQENYQNQELKIVIRDG